MALGWVQRPQRKEHVRVGSQGGGQGGDGRGGGKGGGWGEGGRKEEEWGKGDLELRPHTPKTSWSLEGPVAWGCPCPTEMQQIPVLASSPGENATSQPS